MVPWYKQHRLRTDTIGGYRLGSYNARIKMESTFVCGRVPSRALKYLGTHQDASNTTVDQSEIVCGAPLKIKETTLVREMRGPKKKIVVPSAVKILIFGLNQFSQLSLQRFFHYKYTSFLHSPFGQNELDRKSL